MRWGDQSWEPQTEKKDILALAPGQLISLGSLVCLFVYEWTPLEFMGCGERLGEQGSDKEFLSLQSPILTRNFTHVSSLIQSNRTGHGSKLSHVLEYLEDIKMPRWGSRCRIQRKKLIIQQGNFLHLVNSKLLAAFFLSFSGEIITKKILMQKQLPLRSDFISQRNYYNKEYTSERSQWNHLWKRQQ